MELGEIEGENTCYKDAFICFNLCQVNRFLCHIFSFEEA